MTSCAPTQNKTGVHEHDAWIDSLRQKEKIDLTSALIEKELDSTLVKLLAWKLSVVQPTVRWRR